MLKHQDLEVLLPLEAAGGKPLGVLCSEQFCSLAKILGICESHQDSSKGYRAELFADLAGHFHFGNADFSAAPQRPEDIICQTGAVCR